MHGRLGWWPSWAWACSKASADRARTLEPPPKVDDTRLVFEASERRASALPSTQGQRVHGYNIREM